MSPDTDLAIREFLDRLAARLEAGAREYGDKSFDTPLPAISGNLLEEVEDVAGWAFVMWRHLAIRLGRVEAKAALDFGPLSEDTGIRSSPLVKGGQCRTDESVERDGWSFFKILLLGFGLGTACALL